MKEYYRIGETASLMGITTQTLRFYDKIGLVKPIKIDPRTGYRYYAYEQFHFIDRIKPLFAIIVLGITCFLTIAGGLKRISSVMESLHMQQELQITQYVSHLGDGEKYS